MLDSRFVHLRLHSEYSVTDGIVRLDDAVARAVAFGMPALALTDLANLYPPFEAMAEVGLLLLVHGEVTDAEIDIFDRERVFIGSLNLDPRSARLNTEMGVVIESVPLATAMQTSLEETVPQYAYAVTLDQQQRLQWQDPESGSLSRKEPQAGFWKRVAAKLLSFLPIEGLL